MRRSAAIALVLTLGLTSAELARGIQQVPPAGVDIDDAELFKPATDAGAFVSLYDSVTLPRGRFSLGTWIDYANEALDARLRIGGDEQNISLVNHLVTMNLVAAVGLASRVELGVHAPLYVTSLAGRQVGFERLSGTDFNVGDFAINSKIDVLSRGGGEGFGLAVVPMIGLPTGNRREFAGTGKVSGGGLVIADFVSEPWRLGVNLGGVVRDGFGGRGGDDDFEDQFKWGVAVSRQLDPGVVFIGEAFGSTDAGDPFGSEFRSPVEMIGALRVSLGPIDLTGGVGGGLNSGKNDARFRLLVGVTSASATSPTASAAADAVDLTSSRKTYVVEDHDRSGQVSPGDVIVYTITLVNTGRAAARDIVVIDPIPVDTEFVPGTILWNDEPVADAVGYSSAPPRIELGVTSLGAAADGNQMTIKFKARIRTGVRSLTSVRNEARIRIGGDSEFGLSATETAVFPVTTERERAFVTPSPISPKPRLEITQNIQFETNQAVLRRESHAVLDDVASILRERPEIEVRIVGHTDDAGSAGANLRLSKERAEGVKKYLVGKGIEARRLDALGKGAVEPIASNQTASGRAANRRVEFLIVKGGAAR